MSESTDLITTEVISHRLGAASDEMMATLIKSAYSPNIKERNDCSTAIFDSDGKLTSLTAIAPIHLSSLAGLVENLNRRFDRSDIRPGDVFLTNDPYEGGGSHLPDLTLASPVFFDGRLVAFVASLAHHSDIGGKVAGSESADCSSIFQEGLRIPIVRIVDGGGFCEDILSFVRINSRTPREREGDLRAQIAANNIGVRRIEEIYERFGTATVAASIDAMLEYSERRTRQEIAKLPDGVYSSEDFLDSDGISDQPIRLAVKVTISGDRINFDFTGSAAQVGGARNMPLVATLSTVYYVVKAITDPMLPPNSGYFRAISVTAPEGSVLNPVSPAAVGDRAATGNVLGDVLMAAFADVAPERVMAGCGPLHGLILSGADRKDGRYFVDYETFAGASGGMADQDGRDAVRVHVSGSANLPIEALEQEFPIVVERYELIPDSGGPGRFRGGLATRRNINVPGRARLAGRGLRQVYPAQPLFGGHSGKLGRFSLKANERDAVQLPSSFSELSIEPGSVVQVETPSGAGYGDPLDRDVERVAADVLSGKVTTEGARIDYGVVVTGGKIDLNATAVERRRIRSGRSNG